MSTLKAQSKTQKNSFTVLMSSSMVGLWLGMIGLPFEHPFDCVKTNMQAYQTNFLQTFRKIYSQQGIKGFYSGFSVNSLRVASKQAYRWPLQISLLGFYNNLFEKKISRTTAGIFSGMTMAAIEVGILCPFQRIKVWLMTAHLKSKGIRLFFSTFPMKSLFDGFTPVFLKQLISWVTFMGATEYLKQVTYEYSGKDRRKDSLSWFQVGFVSIGVALINTLFVMPVDCVKTHSQRYSADSQSRNRLSFWGTTKKIYGNYGLRGLFKGWETKLIQYNINSFFTVTVFQALLKQYQFLTLKNSTVQ